MKSILFILILAFSTPLFCQLETYPATVAKEKPQRYTGERLINTTSANNRDAGDLIVSDDFSDFGNWNAIALIGEPNWELVLEEPEEILTYMYEMVSTTEANGFGLFNGIQYLIGDSVEVQDAVLEYASTIDCSEIDHVTLSFEQRYRAFHTDQTFVEVSNNGGISYDFSYEINADVANHGLVQSPIYLNISEAAAGEEFIKVRFRWIEETGDPYFGSGYGWMLDDFKVFESWDYDQKITGAFHRSGLGGYMPNGMEYYQIPDNQVTEMFFSAKVENIGGAIQENLKLNVEISGAGDFSTSSSVIDLAINSSDSLVCLNTYLPPENGIYFLKYWFDSDSTEQITQNDTIYDSFEVSYSLDAWDSPEGKYGRHKSEYSGNIMNVESNSGSPLLIGNVMEVFYNSINYDRAYVEVTNELSNIGQYIYVQVMKYDTITEAFIYLDQTEDTQILESNNGEVIDLYFADELCTNIGDVLIVLAGHYGGDEVGFRLAQPVDYGTVLGYTSGSIDPFTLDFPRAVIVGLYPQAGSPCWLSVDEESENANSIDIYPNPFSESTTIEYELIVADDVYITISDIAGKIIREINLPNQSSGQHQIQLNATDFSEGVYFYTFNVGDEQVTKRMIITK